MGYNGAWRLEGREPRDMHSLLCAKPYMWFEHWANRKRRIGKVARQAWDVFQGELHVFYLLTPSLPLRDRLVYQSMPGSSLFGKGKDCIGDSLHDNYYSLSVGHMYIFCSYSCMESVCSP